MIYQCTVKHNGVTYPAGAEVPAGATSTKPKKAKEVKEETEEKKAE